MVSRSLTASGPVPSLSVKFVATRSRPSSSSANFPSNVLFVKSPRTSRHASLLRLLLLTPANIISTRLISASNPPPSWLFRKPLRHTSSLSLRTLTSPPSTPSVLLSNPRILPSPGGSGATVHHRLLRPLLFLVVSLRREALYLSCLYQYLSVSSNFTLVPNISRACVIDLSILIGKIKVGK